jgi:uncharacterized protein
MVARTTGVRQTSRSVPPPLPPGPTTDRLPALDTLRGVAVCGILLANVFVFFGLFIAPPDVAVQLSASRADRVVVAVEHILVAGKFYSVFSLLFGIGFGLQLARRGADALPLFRRRLRVLMLLGAVHALLVWAGDILLLYGLLGFTLPWFARRTSRQLVQWMWVLLAAPTLLYVIALVAWMSLAGPGPGGQSSSSGPPAEVIAIIARAGTGGLLDGLVANLLFFVGRWADLFASVRFPKVLGMFVLGLWLVRAGVIHAPESHARLLRRSRTLGLGLGLAANIVAWWAGARWPYLPPSAGGLVGVVAQAIGYPLLAVGYAAAVALAAHRHRWLSAAFAPAGRMALTNYLTQSVICVVLAMGYGFGLWWQVGPAATWLIAALIIGTQLVMSALWLRRYRLGPAEWLWRRLAFGGPLPLRR